MSSDAPPPPPKQIVLAFDAYGTLLSTESIAKELASHFGDDKAAVVARDWRTFQLEYTWRLNSMDLYQPFSTVTANSLHHALSTSSLTLTPSETTSLLENYNTLSLFPDVPALFPLLRNPSSSFHLTPVIFSNGTHEMISTSLSQSPDLSPHADIFQKIVVVEGVRRFKPAPEVYRYLCGEVGKGAEGQERDVWLVSGNPFDVLGARAVGLRTCWVDRAGLGWVDRLMGEGGPDVVVRGVDEVVGGFWSFLG